MAEAVKRHMTGESPSEGMARIRAEYREMPGLRLTCDQVARLCGLQREACEQLLAALVETGYLERADDGCYTRPPETRSLRAAVQGSARRKHHRA
jgi:DNA-binding IclR family transcriptional regulator